MTDTELMIVEARELTQWKPDGQVYQKKEIVGIY
jgi:hypothetical protein